MQGNDNRGHVRRGIQSLMMVLQVCVLISLQIQEKSSILVESWSPRVHPFSAADRRPATAFQYGTKARISNTRPPYQFPTGGSRISLATAADSDDDEPQFIQVESLSASQVMELIELSFFQACYALSKGDVEPLKLFIVAVTTATKKYKGASAIALAMTVDALPPSVRPLEPQERDLRETWIRAVYLIMGHVLEGFDSGSGGDDDDEVAQTYGPVLADLVAIHRTGMGLNANQFVESRRDILLPRANVLVLEDGPEDDDLVRQAVVTQTINVLFTTLVVLEEEENDDDNSSDPSVTEDVSSSRSPPTPPAKKKKKKKNAGSSGKGFG